MRNVNTPTPADLTPGVVGLPHICSASFTGSALFSYFFIPFPNWNPITNYHACTVNHYAVTNSNGCIAGDHNKQDNMSAYGDDNIQGIDSGDLLKNKIDTNNGVTSHELSTGTLKNNFLNEILVDNAS
jgi:hypothetical protein